MSIKDRPCRVKRSLRRCYILCGLRRAASLGCSCTYDEQSRRQIAEKWAGVSRRRSGPNCPGRRFSALSTDSQGGQLPLSRILREAGVITRRQNYPIFPPRGEALGKPTRASAVPGRTQGQGTARNPRLSLFRLPEALHAV